MHARSHPLPDAIAGIRRGMVTVSAGKASLSCRVATPWLPYPEDSPLALVRVDRRASRGSGVFTVTVRARVWSAGAPQDSAVPFTARTGGVLCAHAVRDDASGAVYTYIVAVVVDGDAVQLKLLRFERTGLAIIASTPIEEDLRSSALLHGPSVYAVYRSSRHAVFVRGAGVRPVVLPALAGPVGAWTADAAMQIVVNPVDETMAMLRVDAAGAVTPMGRVASSFAVDIVAPAPREKFALLTARDCSTKAVCTASGRVLWSVPPLEDEAPLRMTLCGRFAVLRTRTKRAGYLLDCGESPAEERRWQPIESSVVASRGAGAGPGAFVVGFADAIGVADWQTGNVDVVVKPQHASSAAAAEQKAQGASASGAQLAAVRDNLQMRLKDGIDGVLEAMRVAQDKGRLADNSLSLLQHLLAGTLHLPKREDAPARMHVLADRSDSSQAEDAIGGDAVGNTDAAGGGRGEGCADVLRSVELEQVMDESQQFLLLAVRGVVSKGAWADDAGADAGKPVRMRLDIEVQSAVSMQWELSYAAVSASGDEVHLYARTPWQCVLACTAGAHRPLKVHIEVKVDNNLRSQQLGAVDILSPAALLQKHALSLGKASTPDASRTPRWRPEEETMISVGENHHPDFFLLALADTRAVVACSSSVTKVVVSAPSAMALATYFSAVHLSIADSSSLRVFEASKKQVLLLRKWLDALRAEIGGVQAASKKCHKGLDEACIAGVVDLQIALDEACGYAKEANAY